MLIDWFTVGAQVVNFLVLVWLLKRYLYRPMLTAIDAREKDLSSRRAAVVADQKQAHRDEEESKRQKESWEQQRLDTVKAARDEAKSERERLMQEAQRDIEHLRATRGKELEQATADYQEELIRLAREEIIATVRKILAELASTELDDATVAFFLRRLNENGSLEKLKTNGAVSDSLSHAIRLRSAFLLSSAQQETATKEIQRKFQTGEKVAFEVAPNLDLGLELILHDQKISWNIDSYLDSFKSQLVEFAKKKTEKTA